MYIRGLRAKFGSEQNIFFPGFSLELMYLIERSSPEVRMLQDTFPYSLKKKMTKKYFLRINLSMKHFMFIFIVFHTVFMLGLHAVLADGCFTDSGLLWGQRRFINMAAL